MTERHVVPVGDSWQVEKEDAKRPSAKAATEAQAVIRATQIVANEGGGRVIIHSPDGTVSESREVHTAKQPQAVTPSATAASGPEAEPGPSDDSRVKRGRAKGDTTDDVSTYDVSTDDVSTNDVTDHDAPDGKRPWARNAADRVAHRNSLHLDLPWIGSVALPPPDQLAYLGGITTLVAVGILEWPVAALIGAGHLLASTRNSKILAEFGEALEEA